MYRFLKRGTNYEVWFTQVLFSIKLGSIIGYKGKYIAKKLEKWEIFNFADVHLKHIYSNFTIQLLKLSSR